MVAVPERSAEGCRKIGPAWLERDTKAHLATSRECSCRQMEPLDIFAFVAMSCYRKEFRGELRRYEQSGPREAAVGIEAISLQPSYVMILCVSSYGAARNVLVCPEGGAVGGAESKGCEALTLDSQHFSFKKIGECADFIRREVVAP